MRSSLRIKECKMNNKMMMKKWKSQKDLREMKLHNLMKMVILLKVNTMTKTKSKMTMRKACSKLMKTSFMP